MSKTYEIKIGTTELSGLTKYEVEWNELLASADRNLNGDLQADFIGVFPRITIGFTYLSESDLSDLLTLIKDFRLSVEYWDTESGTYKTADFYKSGFKYPYFNKEKELYEPFEVNLIAFSKR